MTPEQREAILDTLRTCGTLGQALRGAGVRVRAWAEAVAADEALRDVAAEAARVGGEARAAREKEASDGEQGQGEGDAATRVSGSGVGPVVASEPRRKDGPARRDEGEAQADSAREAGGETVDERVVRLPWSAQSKGPEPCERPGLPGADPGQRLVDMATAQVSPPSSTPPPLAPQARLAEWQRAPGGRERFAEPIAVTAAREDEERREVAALDGATPPRRGRLNEDGEVDWQGFRDETRERYGDGPGLYPLLLLQDDRLVEAGYIPMSPWWRWSTREFFASGKRWGVWLAGRGMGKSTTLTRLAALGGVWCPRIVPPMQRWVWPFISVRPTDADSRLQEIGGILATAYGTVGRDAQDRAILPDITAPRSVPTIRLVDANGQPVAYNSLASTIGNVKGPNVMGIIFDEEAAMRHAGSNPSGEILASIIGAFRTREGIFGIRCSSAWERDGSHWNAVEAGDTVTNFVATIGAQFLDAAVSGFLDVADWEAAQGAKDVARAIRAHALSLTAGSRGIPTWVGNTTIGAIASRIDMQALDDKTLNALYPGLTRSGAWLREFGSVPPVAAGTSGAAAWCEGLADRNRALNDRAPRDRVLGGGEAERPRRERRTVAPGRRML